MSSRIAAGGLALLVLAGCNGGAAGLAAQSAASLHERVAAVRTAADSHDRAAAMAAVDAFRAEVQRLLNAGELTKDQAASLLAHADAVAADVLNEVVALVSPTATPTPSPSPDPSPTPAPAASPEQVQVLRQETADRLTELLRQRLDEYVKQRLAEEKAAQKRAAEQRRAERVKDRNKGGKSGGSR